VCFLLLLALSASARIRAVQHPNALPSPKSVMWIAAHPDDEAIAAPLLSWWCRDNNARCAFLIATRGEAGNCVRSEGCAPDIASVRSGEAGSASQYFKADLILLSLPDGGGSEPPSWQPSIDTPDVVSALAGYIQAFKPEIILTFDPRHGTTCHPDHRALAADVLEAVKQLSFQPQVYLLETRVTVTLDPFAIRFMSAGSAAEKFDANQPLSSTHNSAWAAITEDMKRHPSQFDSRWIQAVENTPQSDRAVYLAPAETILHENVSTCP